MKKTKIGQVKIKLNAKGHAKESYEVTRYDYDSGKSIKTGEMKERNIYSMQYQPRNKMFKASKNEFNPVTFEAYSYGWWCYVKKIKGRVVFNDHRYSMTTNKHQSEMRSLLRQLGIKVDLYVNMRSSLEKFETHALEPMYEELFQLEIEIERKGSKPDANKTRRARIRQLKRDIALARKLGAKLSKQAAKDLRETMRRNEESRVAKMQAEREETRNARKMAREAMNSGDVFATNF